MEKQFTILSTHTILTDLGFSYITYIVNYDVSNIFNLLHSQ